MAFENGFNQRHPVGLATSVKLATKVAPVSRFFRVGANLAMPVALASPKACTSKLQFGPP